MAVAGQRHIRLFRASPAEWASSALPHRADRGSRTAHALPTATAGYNGPFGAAGAPDAWGRQQNSPGTVPDFLQGRQYPLTRMPIPEFGNLPGRGLSPR